MATPHPPIVRRRVKFDFGPAHADGWSRDRRDFEGVLNAISFAFPAGETYFIHSVRAVMGRIADPVLKEQAERFVYQEAMHTKEHIRANETLRKIHPDLARIDRVATTFLKWNRRIVPKATQLATSCAIEHFTAMLADDLLRDQDRMIAECDPSFAALWLWHAVEETEHKAVCMDIYQHIYGKGPIAYLHRVGVMAVASLMLVSVLAVVFAGIKWKDRKRPKISGIGGGPKISVLMGYIPMRMYFDYYRYSFHPWDHENSHLVEQWKQYYSEHGMPRETQPEPVPAGHQGFRNDSSV